jgi:hypothetical protein
MRSKIESKITYDSIKRVLDTKHIECTICNKIISKTNWSKHEKTLIHNSETNASKNRVSHELTSKPQNSVSTNKQGLARYLAQGANLENFQISRGGR